MTLFGLHGKSVPCVLKLTCHHCEDISNPFVCYLTCELLDKLGH